MATAPESTFDCEHDRTPTVAIDVNLVARTLTEAQKAVGAPDEEPALVAMAITTAPHRGSGFGSGDAGGSQSGSGAVRSGRRWMPWAIVFVPVGAAALTATLLLLSGKREPIAKAEGPGGPAPVERAPATGVVARRGPASTDAGETRTATRIVVNSIPSGAIVIVDGRRLSEQTPLVLNELQSKRQVELRLTLQGYRSHTQLLLPSAGRTIEHLHRFVAVPAQRPSSGAPAGTGPARSRAVVAKPRASLNEAVRPKVELGYLTIDSAPWAVVSVDGRRVGVTPLFRQPLTAGAHGIELRTSDNRRQKLAIDVTAGRVIKKKIVFGR